MPAATGLWDAPAGVGELDATVRIPSSKSLTSRYLVLAALADEATEIVRAEATDDTELMVEALRALRVDIAERDTEHGTTLVVQPPAEFRGGATVQVGLAGTVMRFIPAIAALADAPVTFEGVPRAGERPMRGLLDALRALGAEVAASDTDSFPLTVTPPAEVTATSIDVDSSATSQYVTALLLLGSALPNGLRVRHVGVESPGAQHIALTVETLRERGVAASQISESEWQVEGRRPRGGVGANAVVLEPDLSNAVPFLATALVLGGTVRVPEWPETSAQLGTHVISMLEAFGARTTLDGGVLTVSAPGIAAGPLPSGDFDLQAAGELAPNFIGLAALASGPSRFRGIAHLRAHETDRLAALVTNLRAMGIGAEETEDGMIVYPTDDETGKASGRTAAIWDAFGDHRIATTGALLGLVTPGLQVRGIESTRKTIPNFTELWADTLGQAPAVAHA